MTTRTARTLIVIAIIGIAASFVAFEIAIGGEVPRAQKWAVGWVSALRLALFVAAPVLWSMSKPKGLAASSFSVGLAVVIAVYGANLQHVDTNQRLLYQVLNIGVLLGEATLAMLMSRNSKLEEAEAKYTELDSAFDNLTAEADGYIARIAELELKVSEMDSTTTDLAQTSHELARVKNELATANAIIKKYTQVIEAVGKPQKWGNNQFWTIDKAGKIYRCKRDSTPYLNGEKTKA